MANIHLLKVNIFALRKSASGKQEADPPPHTKKKRQKTGQCGGRKIFVDLPQKIGQPSRDDSSCN